MEKTMRTSMILLAGALGISLLTAGCAATDPANIGGIPATPTVSDTTIGQIQQAAAAACGFVPTVQTVQSIAASFFAGGALINGIVTQVENAICNAVAPKASFRRSAGVPMVNGIPVQGYFLR